MLPITAFLALVADGTVAPVQMSSSPPGSLSDTASRAVSPSHASPPSPMNGECRYIPLPLRLCILCGSYAFMWGTSALCVSLRFFPPKNPSGILFVLIFQRAWGSTFLKQRRTWVKAVRLWREALPWVRITSMCKSARERSSTDVGKTPIKFRIRSSFLKAMPTGRKACWIRVR